MFGKAAGEVLGSGISALARDAANEKGRLGEVFRRIASHPVKVLASFIAAPFLIVRVALRVRSPRRRAVALVGLLLSVLLSYGAATFLGTLVGAAFVASHIGLLAGIGFLFGTTLSVYLSVIFSIVVFHAVSFVFLKISSQEVLDYLREISS
ncbi:hypothetical protein E0E54_01395 [Azotobacter chroococcum]|uniref:Uncharacterized protein n=1 Tax=Azotobacter chroococcum TaxID=353 RepID=A0A4Q9VUT2_9GAMM|nr:hypothetical protein [Azotobacter chroococcum]OHC11090.1 MAG: hypothetical protein A2002_10360 [Pseudomonadales bacterium GWC1_66_9]ASL28634.1 hypothetical protein ACG10_09990 [Azotobacter chroococcum]QQE90680.1 hypothetical protein GKQ51_10680 [Azotobacter chroococcum]TBW39849.1 hypothetical protein E0E54_01395 [Azotobacter chroococcum]TKD33005.1 hypothetical protein FCG41_21425 [Azotobacter chroococcum]